MSNIIEQLQETTAFIQNIYSHSPQIGIVLGSGLGNFANELIIEQEIPYDQIPHFPVSTVEGHSGKLMFVETLQGCWIQVAEADRNGILKACAMFETIALPLRCARTQPAGAL